MISYIKGELVELTENAIVLDHDGMGFLIMMPASILAKLPAIGSELKVHTYLYVKEDALDLYGFLTKDDLKVFRLLITVSGIGPKGALAILSTMSPDDLRFAVLAGDSKTISKAPGIGSKTAQKLIIELKDKLKIEDVLDGGVDGGYEPQSDMGDTAAAEAVMALTALGYSSADATRAVRQVDGGADMDSEALLKAALKKLAFM